MNILPTSPHSTFSSDDIDRYFRDMKRWNYDVAYNAFYAFPLNDVLGKFRNSYEGFAKKAAEEGFRACIQIQSTVGNLEDVSIGNAQHFLDNTVYTYEHFVGSGRKYFFGSFAANGWLEYLKKITRIFKELGFEWVVYEEPMFHVDIPGTKDEFYKIFKGTYPDLDYPTKQAESVEYYKVQELKQKVLIDFYDNLTRYAKEIGYEKVGIMPWFFSPTSENTPIETWSPCCDTAKITFLKHLDFIIVRMQPDNILSEAMIASSGESLPRLVYTEVLAHSLGKPTIAVNNPTNEHTPPGLDDIFLIPLNYFKKYTLASASAVPSGMSRHWYGKNYYQDIEQMTLLSEVNKYLPKFGKAVSPIAFLFSTHSQAKRLPRSWKDIWKIYWRFVENLQYKAKMPFITLFADRLKECLENHPEVKVIILSEYFPVSREEINLLKKWVSTSKDKVLIYFGSKNGYRYDFAPLFYSFDWRPIELLEIFDVDTSKPVTQFTEDDVITLKFSGRDNKEAFLGKRIEIECAGFGVPVFKKFKDNPKSKWVDLYKTEPDGYPIIRRKTIKNGGNLIFVSFSLDTPENSLPILEIMKFALLKSGFSESPFPLIKDATRGILWNQAGTGFFIVSNIYSSPGRYKVNKKNIKLWDVKKSQLLSPPFDFKIAPLDFQVFRIISSEDEILDLEGMVYLSSIEKRCQDSANTFKITGFFSKNIQIKSLKLPGKILFNKKEIPFSYVDKKGYFKIKITCPQIGDAEIMIFFIFNAFKKIFLKKAIANFL